MPGKLSKSKRRTAKEKASDDLLLQIAQVEASLAKDQELLAIEELNLQQYENTHKIEFFKPFVHQASGVKHVQDGKKTVLVVGANRVGKCQTYSTLIDTTKGSIPMGILYERGESFDVFSWDGEKKVMAKAYSPVKKSGIHKCYRITMSDGRWVEVADNHRILTASGWHFVDTLHQLFSSLPQPIEDTCPSVHGEGGQHYVGTRSGFREHCFGSPRPCGEQPQMGRDISPIHVPLQGDAQQHVAALSRAGDWVSRYTNIRRSTSSLLSNLDVLLRCGDRFFEILSRIACRISIPFFSGFQLSPILATAGAFEPQQDFLGARSVPERNSSSLAYCPPLCIDGNHIISITPISTCQEVYDFEVEKYHNYFAGGLIHHNSVFGVALAGAFSLGCKCPWDGADCFPSDGAHEREGKEVNGRILCNDWEKAARDTIVPLLKEWLPEGSYETKKNNVGVEFEFYFPKWKSRITILTYKEDTKSHEGKKLDWLLCDEPPPRDKYVANRRGLVDYNGVCIMAMTAISEPWILDEIVLNPDPSTGIVSDIPIEANTTLSEESIRIFASSLTEDEKIARLKGGWLQLTGRIWKGFRQQPVTLESGRVLVPHIVLAEKVPPDWPVEFQIDFHLNLPHAISFCACDPLQRYFIIDEVWENCGSEELADHIIRLKQANGWRLKYGEIDPLSKGDDAYTHNRFGRSEDSFTIIERKLRKYGIRLGAGSKDEKSYITAVETRLKGVNGMPTLFIMENCKETIKQVSRWSYDKNGTPSDEGHFPECIGRQTQTGLKYTDPAIMNRPLHLAANPL